MAPFSPQEQTDKYACDAVGSMGQKMKCGQGGESWNMISARASRRGFLEEALSELKSGPQLFTGASYKGSEAEADRLSRDLSGSPLADVGCTRTTGLGDYKISDYTGPCE